MKMNTEIILHANKHIRNTRPKLQTNEVCQVFYENNLLEIGFLSKQCQNDLKGCCVMCDYGCAYDTKDNNTYIEEMKRILQKYDGKFDCLLLCTNGSFMDKHQISNELYTRIIRESNKYKFPKLEIETHYHNVTSDKLDVLQQYTSNKEITIEMGLETINEEIQNSLIKKGISLDKYKKKIDMIHSYNFQVDINILLGMPLLTTQEQLDDALETTSWAFNSGCNVVIFPVNIKPFTLLWEMYLNRLYQPISNWLMIEYLINIPSEKLGDVTVAWYGNREEYYECTEDRVVFPNSCPKCQKTLMEFFRKFNLLNTYNEREELINELLLSKECSCYQKMKEDLNAKDILDFSKRLEKCINWIQSDLLNREA